MTSKILEDDLKKNEKKMEDDLKKQKQKRRQKNKKNKNGKLPKQKWKTNQSTKINLIGCDTIVNSPSLSYGHCSKMSISFFRDTYIIAKG